MNWWLANPDRMKKPELLEVLYAIPKPYFGPRWDRTEPTTNLARRKLIRTAQQNYRNQTHGQAKRRPAFKGITATAANAWLRSLPELPIG